MTTRDTPTVRRRGLLSAAGSLPLVVGGIPQTATASTPLELTVEFDEHGSGITDQTIAPGEEYTLAFTLETSIDFESVSLSPILPAEQPICESDEFFIEDVTDLDDIPWDDCPTEPPRWALGEVPANTTIETSITFGSDTSTEEREAFTGGFVDTGQEFDSELIELTIDDDTPTPPSISHLLAPEGWLAPEAGGSAPDFAINVVDADTVELEYEAFSPPFYDDTVTSGSVELDNPFSTTWIAELPVVDEDPGTWVDLTVQASNDDGSVSEDQFAVQNAFDRGDFASEFGAPHQGGNLGYYLFDEVLTCNVAVARFAGRTGYEGEPEISGPSDLRAWQDAIAYDVNTWFGSMKGSMGAVGFEMHFLSADTEEVFEVAETAQTYRDRSDNDDDNAAGIEDFMSDLASAIDDAEDTAVDDNDADFWIGTYLGDSDRLSESVNGSFRTPVFGIFDTEHVYVPMLRHPHDDAGDHTVESTRDTWFHELLHAYGFDHVYEYGSFVEVDGVLGPTTGDPPERGSENLLTSTFTRLGLLTEDRGYEVGDPDAEWISRNDLDVEDDITGNEYTFTQKETAAFTLDDADEMPTFTYETTHRPRIRSVTDRAMYTIDLRRDPQGPQPTGPFLLRETRLGEDADDDDRGITLGLAGFPIDFEADGSVTDTPGVEDPVEFTFELEELDDSGDVLEAELSLRVDFENSTVARLRDGSATTERVFPCADRDQAAVDNPTLPSLDLKAVDPETDEVIVGVDDTGEYVIDPDDHLEFARASGKRPMGLEWIAVPEDADVDFVVASDDVDTYNERVGDSRTLDTVDYSIAVVTYSEDSALTAADDTGREFDVTDTDVRVIDAESIDPGTERRSNPELLRESLDIATIEPSLIVAEQYVKIVNVGDEPVDLSGFEIGPDADPDTAFAFTGDDAVVLEPSETVAVWTGTESAVDPTLAAADHDVYWGRTDRVWDRERDAVWLRDGDVTVIRDRYNRQLPPVGDRLTSPQDRDEDGLYEDVVGDGAFTIDDVELLFEELESDRIQRHAPAYNFSETDPETVTVADVQALYDRLQSGGGG